MRLRREIAYWTMLFLGLLLNVFQSYKYVTNQLEYSWLELTVLVVGVAFNFAPRFILNMASKIIDKKMQ